MTALGAVFLLLAIAAVIARRGMFVWVLAASSAFPASAALVVAGQTVTPFHMLAILAGVLLAFQPGRLPRGKGRIPLAIFTVWSLFITAVGPMLFAGSRVLSPGNSVDEELASPSYLTFSLSSVSQAGYMGLGIVCIYFLAGRKISPMLPALPLALGTCVSSLRAAFAAFDLPWPESFFDNSTRVVYSDLSLGIESRLRGVFAEPSELAGFTMAAIGYFVVMIPKTQGLVRWACVVVVALALINLNLSSSGTALVAIGVFALVGGVAMVSKFFRGGGRGAPGLVFGVLAAASLAVLFGAEIAQRGAEILDGKIDSHSSDARSRIDAFSLELFAQTIGLGVGLGGNRPSSFAIMLLSCVGVVGTLSLALFLFRILRAVPPKSAFTGAGWGLIALLIAKIVALPDLSTPLLWVLVATCTHAAWVDQSRAEGDGRPADARATRFRFKGRLQHLSG